MGSKIESDNEVRNTLDGSPCDTQFNQYAHKTNMLELDE